VSTEGRGTARRQGDIGRRVVDAILYMFATGKGLLANNQHNDMRNERFMLFIWFWSHKRVCSLVQESGRRSVSIGYGVFKMRTNHIVCPQAHTPPADKRSRIRPRFATVTPKVDDLKQQCPRVGLWSGVRRPVSYAQLLEPDTRRVPETRGVQCCLDHGSPCWPSRVSWCDCNLRPFLPHVMTAFP
jgi:hypothetical protein